MSPRENKKTHLFRVVRGTRICRGEELILSLSLFLWRAFSREAIWRSSRYARVRPFSLSLRVLVRCAGFCVFHSESQNHEGERERERERDECSSDALSYEALSASERERERERGFL